MAECVIWEEDDMKIIQPQGNQEGGDGRVGGWSWEEYLSTKNKKMSEMMIKIVYWISHIGSFSDNSK